MREIFARRLSGRDSVFIDASAFYAIADPNERRNHSVAVARYNKFLNGNLRMYTSNFILAETHALILNRTRRSDIALNFLLNTYNSPNIMMVYVTLQDEEKARDILTRYSDKLFTYTDATSFSIMERLKITNAFTFDSDYQQYGWILLK
jgi:uncharacterized protein